MYFKQLIGKTGEDIALRYLINKNHKIITRNFKCKQGEIDIIAKDCKKNELVFIEVKTRNNNKYGKPAEAVDIKKQKHIYKTGEYYLMKNNIKDIPIRLDIIEIYLYKNEYKVNHIKQAFGS